MDHDMTEEQQMQSAEEGIINFIVNNIISATRVAYEINLQDKINSDEAFADRMLVKIPDNVRKILMEKHESDVTESDMVKKMLKKFFCEVRTTQSKEIKKLH